jgi:hypothetical protein
MHGRSREPSQGPWDVNFATTALLPFGPCASSARRILCVSPLSRGGSRLGSKREWSKVPAQLFLRCRRSTLRGAVSGFLFVYGTASHRLTKLSPSLFIVRPLVHIARALCGLANGVRSVTGLCFGIHASLAVAFVAIRLGVTTRARTMRTMRTYPETEYRASNIMNREIRLNQRSSTL